MKDIFLALREAASNKQKEVNKRFFKTDEYASNIEWVGINMPTLRKLAKDYHIDITSFRLKKLLTSKINEYRMCGFLILMYKFEGGDEKEKTYVYNLYFRNLKYLNNWDLIDTTTPNIIGMYIKNNTNEFPRIEKLANSKNLWKRRIALLACFPLIKAGKFRLPIKICKKLLNDREDLINKATGWMLREMYKQDEKFIKSFIKKYCVTINRTTLRYAIEKMDEKERKLYLSYGK